MRKFGLIAGNGVFPLEVAAAARQRGFEVIAVAHRGETQPALSDLVDRITWVRPGELQRLIDALKEAGVFEAAMAGGLTRVRLPASLAPDARALALMARLPRLADDAVLRAVAEELESEGIRIIDPVPMLDGALAGHGLQAGPQPSASQLRDLDLAFEIIRALGGFDVGQAVAVRDGTVAAIEAIEGTDAALRRAAALAGPGLVVAKAAKAGQDMRFDRPAVGPATVELLAELGAAMLGVEADHTLVLERSRTLALATERGITLFGHG